MNSYGSGQVVSIRPSWILYNGLILAFILGWIPRALLGLDVGGMLDGLLLCVSVVVLYVKGLQSRLALYLCAIGLYVGVGGILAVWFRSVNLLDFLAAYKFLWYLAILVPLASQRVLSARQISRLLRLGLVAFLAVYCGKMIFGSGRPIFFTENNFELLFICLLFVAGHVSTGRTSFVDVVLLLAISVLSGSRSGAALAAVVVMFSFDYRRLRSVSSLLILFGGAASVLLAGFVFSSRTTGGVQSIDRYMFFLGLVDSTSDWPWWKYFVGAARISPLPVDVCSRLSFYDTLFSYSGDGSCYSVVLHSFLMRVVYDHGLIVTFLSGWLICKLMVGVPGRSKLCVLVLLVFNGMSVSSINSIYAALGLAFVCSAGAARLDDLQRRVK